MNPKGLPLDLFFDSWDRNNTILINLLRALPEGGLTARALPGSPTVGEMFAHMNYVRLVFLSEDVPGVPRAIPREEWSKDEDVERMAEALKASGQAVGATVRQCIESGQEMQMHYDHPMLFVQHMIWHEGYHHGQIKLALKAAGTPLEDNEIGPLTWGVWMKKT